MGLVAPHNPFGRTAPMVDKLIGDAFDIVKEVHDNLDYIKAVADTLMISVVGQPLLAQRALFSDEGFAPLAGESTVIDFPDVSINYKAILASHVIIEGSDGNRYFADGGFFTAYVAADGLHLSLKSNAPGALQEAPVSWFIIYGSSD